MKTLKKLYLMIMLEIILKFHVSVLMMKSMQNWNNIKV